MNITKCFTISFLFTFLIAFLESPSLRSFIVYVFGSLRFVMEETFRNLCNVWRSQVFNSILFLEVVEFCKDGFFKWVLVKVGDVKGIGFYSYWKHCLLIKSDYSVAGVFVCKCCCWSRNDIMVNWFSWFHSSSNIKVLSMNMSKHTCSNDMLKSISKDLISLCKWVHTVMSSWRNMGNNDCFFSCSFHISKSIFKPL